MLSIGIKNTCFGQASAGLRAGLSLTNTAIEPSINETENNLGYTLAIMFENQFSGLFALQTEARLIQKGYKSMEPNLEFVVNYNYYGLSILPQLGIQKNNFRINVLGGPYLDYALGGNTITKISNPGLPLEVNKNKIDFSQADFNRFEFGLEGGLELKFITDSGSISLQGRYFNALTNAFPNDAFNVFNRGFHISLGYLYQTYE